MHVQAFTPVVYLKLLGLYTLLLLTACGESLPDDKIGGPGGGSPPAGTFNDLEYANAEAVKGGKLYEKWFTGAATPRDINPLWEALGGDSNSKDGESWQCVKCHGYDYKGNKFLQGSPGIKVTTKNDQEVFEFIKNGSITLTANNTLEHKFADKITNDKDIYDLTRFIKDEANKVISLPLRGNNTNLGEILFKKHPNSNRGCNESGCHASDLDNIKKIAETEPFRFIHAVRFGRLNKSMPDDLTIGEAKNLIGFLLAAPATEYDSTLFGAADPIEGGKLYDEWWTVVNTPPPTGDHPLWQERKAAGFPPTIINTRTGDATWRCVECHGWDYLGKDGTYDENNNHYTGFTGIQNKTAAKQKQPKDIFIFLQNSHSYNGFIPDEKLYALTKFINDRRNEAPINKISAYKQAIVNDIDDVLGGPNNIDNNGKTLYEGPLNCASASCHGPDGKTLPFQSSQSIHSAATKDPWSFVHKVLYGQPGQAMPAMADDTFSFTPLDAINLLAYAQIINPDIKRGGRLFDNWAMERLFDDPNFPEPIIEQPNWISRPKDPTGNYYYDAPSIADTWRCKECHGWDYKGNEGIYGPAGDHNSGRKSLLFTTANWALTQDTNSALKQIIGAINNPHSFFSYSGDKVSGIDGLTLRDINDLAHFLVNEIGDPRDEGGNATSSDVSEYISGSLSGEINNGKTAYSVAPGSCANVECHGENGDVNPNVDITNIAKRNPERFIHKVRFGFPNSQMIPDDTDFVGLTLPIAADVLAYSRSLTAPINETSYDNASIVRGGRLFDAWWVEKTDVDTIISPPSVENPHWQYRDQFGDQNLNSGDATWRCITCHGWDYQGRNGINQSGSDYTGFKGINNAINRAPQQLFATLRDGFTIPSDNGINLQAHNFSEYLDDRDLWDLVKFIKEGQFNSELVIRTVFDPLTGQPIYIPAGGSVLIGKTLYETPSNETPPGGNCANSACHGPDGDARNFADINATPKYLGHAARENPFQFMHKAQFGQPGTVMPGTVSADLTTQEMIDIMTYVLTLNVN